VNLVHCKQQPYTVYIGRGGPLGNPFSHLPAGKTRKTRAQVQVATVEDAVDCCDRWARGETAWDAVVPTAQRARFLRVLDMLDANDVLGCWCQPGAPCHGVAIMRLWAERKKSR
jgi:hypothetical protein